MPTTVDVSEQVIARSVRGNPESCMISNALNPLLRAEATAYTSKCRVLLDHRDWGVKASIPLPEDVRAKVHAFDCGSPVAPFSFELDVPEYLLKGAQ